MMEDKGIPVFYTDDEAKLEMKENRKIHQELINLIGPEAIDTNGVPVKNVLSQYICQGTDNADKVNAIVHPQVRQRAMRWKESQCSRRFIAIECALLFESGFQNLCDKVITVAAPLETRIKRVCRRDNTTPQKAKEWIKLQMPQEEKERLSDFVINNDGVADIEEQLNKIMQQL